MPRSDKRASPSTSSTTSKPSAQSSALTFTPHEYQRDAMKFLLSRAAAGLFLDPGYGKTAITLHTLEILRQRKMIRRTLVVAKLRIIQKTWPEEIAKWGLPIKYRTLHGPKKALELEKDADLYLINYEGLDWLARQRLPADKFDVLVCDESSKLKDTRTQRFKNLRALLPLFKRRYILTGSPIPNSLMDIFGQVFVLDGGASLGKYITHFRNQYFLPSGYMGYEWRARDGAEDDIFRKLERLVLRLPSNLLDLPPLSFVDRYVSLPDGVAKAYQQVEQEFALAWSDGLVTAANAAVATGKLRQIANGSVYGENRAVLRMHDEKLEELVDLVEELAGKPVFVAYEFQHDLDAIKSRFPNAPHLGAGVSAKQATAIIDDFNAGRVPVLLGQPQSVAHGLNLQGSAHNVIFYSLPWSLENYEQFIRRVWRQGQKNHVTVYRILARATIDEAVTRALDVKDKTQQNLLRALEERYGKQAKVRGK